MYYAMEIRLALKEKYYLITLALYMTSPKRRFLQTRTYERKKSNLFLRSINHSFFMIFCLVRGLKKLNLKYAFEFASDFDATQKCNLQRISNPNGGYQEKIKERFTLLMKKNFQEFYSCHLLEFLFPESSSFEFSTKENLHDLQIAEYFEKYV